MLPGIANLIYRVFVRWRVATNKCCTNKNRMYHNCMQICSTFFNRFITKWRDSEQSYCIIRLSVFLITMQMKSCLLFAGYNRNHMHCIILYIIITVTWSQELTRLDHHAGQSGSKRMCGVWLYDLCLASGFSDQAILPWWCENKKNFLFLISGYLTTFSTEQKPFEKKSFKTHL